MRVCKEAGCVLFDRPVTDEHLHHKPEAVNHPAHYGGADNPYEVIKVMEAWLTPEEFVGALKFNIHKYTARASKKDGLEAHEKSLWYQNCLVDYLKRHKNDAPSIKG